MWPSRSAKECTHTRGQSSLLGIYCFTACWPHHFCGGGNAVQAKSANTFVNYAEKFLAMLREERGASEHTLRAYGREVRGFAEYLSETLGESGDVRKVE